LSKKFGRSSDWVTDASSTTERHAAVATHAHAAIRAVRHTAARERPDLPTTARFHSAAGMLICSSLQVNEPSAGSACAGCRGD
jgi:hypothetical protein